MSTSSQRFIIFILTSALVSTVSSQDLPLRISSAYSNDCSSPPPQNLPSNENFDTIQRLLNERYGPPSCMCGSFTNSRRLAFLNMTDPSYQCPSAWTSINTPIRGCGRSTARPSCDSAVFPSNGFSYNRVCGRIIGYQRGTPDAFHNITNTMGTIEQPYVDGISVTHGPPGSRQHIWTFAAALYAQSPGYVRQWNCECTNTNYQWPYRTPSFVGNNYFCDTGNPGPSIVSTTVYSGNPLWDGQGCSSSSTCCEFNRPPWFCISLPQTTSDDIEIRICHDQRMPQEDVIISLAEIYVSLN